MDDPGKLKIATANPQQGITETESPSDEHLETIQKFLERLETLTLMTASVSINSGDRKPCPRCQERSFPSRSGTLKWREIEDGAHNLQCPICQLLFDWLPVEKLPTLRQEPELPNTIRAVLKIGRLDPYMGNVISVGCQYDDRTTGSDCAFQIAAAWMTTCVKEHNNCVVELPVLPTRVLDVGPLDSSQNPRLCYGGDFKALYFTLSYRWNQDRASDYQTTTSNLEAYHTSIPLSTLPQIMQDAILITRKFGVRYLWIDALCIIQDSEGDWQAEAKEMTRIYHNSTLTISAAADPTKENKGIFRPRSRLHTRPFNVKSPWPDGTAKYVFADRRFTNDGARPRTVLDTRAWILQEQLLSPRVLSYSNEELYWDCLSVNASESFPGGIPRFYDADLKLDDLRFFKDAVLGASDHLPSHTRFYESWKKVVETYSEREMTKETDKVAALLGVAQAASILFEDDFLVGLWRKELWRDLLWWVKKPETAARPTNFAAPSWSWASIIASVSYELRGDDSARGIKQCVEVLHAEVESDQTLPVLHGKLILRGRLVDLKFQGSKRVSTTNLPSWKEDMRATDSSKVMCLILGFSSHYVYAIGLIAKEGVEGVYTRAGRVEWTRSPVQFGWDKEQHKWAVDTPLATVSMI
ncbi:heterokaryon incompatibility protein-domain-containing protein [Bisporella sp. PMI_857]|nr:heterokaryon incompatibility protein-domain-containing protein [Bisporella sp. PMI_857]